MLLMVFQTNPNPPETRMFYVMGFDSGDDSLCHTCGEGVKSLKIIFSAEKSTEQN